MGAFGVSPLDRRAAMAALYDAQVSLEAVSIFVQRSVCTVRRWTQRAETTDDLRDLQRPGRPMVYDDQTQLRIIAFYCQTRPFSGGQWSLRMAEAHFESHPDLIDATPSKSTVQRVLKNNCLKPHLSRYFLNITDPDFFPKMELLLALYAAALQNLFFFDECPGIQVLKRLTPDLQTEGSKQKLKEFEYIRNGTIDVFAFMSQSDGIVSIEYHDNHTIETFLGVFERHVNQWPKTEQLHYVMDNLDSHRSYLFCQLVAKLSGIACPPQKMLKTQTQRMAWLQQDDKRIVVHFTPFHGSWLNQVEIWFGIMGKKVLGATFNDPSELLAALSAFVAYWNAHLAHPFRWTYNGQGLHEKALKRFTVMLNNPNDKTDLRTLTKLLKLTTNLVTDYFSQIQEKTWQQFLVAFFKNQNKIDTQINNEHGPQRKKKARAALDELRAALNNHQSLCILNLAA